MKLELVRGCTCNSLTADDVEEINMSEEQRREVINKLSNWMSPKDLNYILQAIIEQFGEYECETQPCECCGDYIEKYTLEI